MVMHFMIKTKKNYQIILAGDIQKNSKSKIQYLKNNNFQKSTGLKANRSTIVNLIMKKDHK